MHALFDLSGKVAVVTGSSKGIGHAIAEALAEHGARVVISSRKPEACAAVADAIRDQGGEALSLPCNVSHEPQMRALVERTLDTWGRIDVLVCNAAANPYYGPFLEIPDAAYEKTMQVNLRGVMHLVRLVIPDMQRRRDGAIVVVSSTGALHGSDRLGTYNLSKIALLMLVKNLCVAYGKDNIRANAILPGLVKTDFARALWEDEKLLAQTLSRTPLGRIATPRDLAGIAVYLASRAGAWTSGQSFVVDGGLDAVE